MSIVSKFIVKTLQIGMVYDINGHVTWLTIGFLFECIDISAAEHGFYCQYEDLPSHDPQLSLFKVTLTHDANIKKSDLYSIIPIRSVQRKPMGTKKLTQNEKIQIEACIPNGFKLHWYETFKDRWKIGKLLYGNSHTRYVMKEGYDVHSKVIDWHKGHEQFSPNKIPPKSLGIDPITLALTKWALAKWQRFHIIEKYFAGTVWARFLMDFYTSIRCSSHFLLTKDHTATTKQDFIESGRITMRLWLTFQKLGFGFQPEHTPVMFAELHRNDTHFSKDKRATQNAKKMDDNFKQLIGEEKVACSIYLARVGRSSLPTSRSLRKKLNELIIL